MVNAGGMIGKMPDLIAEEVIRKITVFPRVCADKMEFFMDVSLPQSHVFTKRTVIIKYKPGRRAGRYDRADFARVRRQEAQS